MKIHDLQPAEGARKSRKRVGRGIGGKGGKTAGRGTKGQKARNKVPVGFEGGQLPLAIRTPKLRGFNNPFRVEYQAINLDTIEESGLDEISPETLLAKGLVSKGALVKVLGRGELTRKVTVKVHGASASAEAAITGAGGTVEKLPLPFKVRPAFHGSAHTNR
jgi:large subunit ribosomal protein L15